jgi:hypothetical protein
MRALLDATPDDKLNWSPSPSARTPLQIVAHSASSIGHITDMLNGIPFQIENSAAADKEMLAWEKQFTTRAATVAVFDENCNKYMTWLDTLSPDQLGKEVEAPFGMGMMQVGRGLFFPPMHTMGHVSQLEYLQTIYGDRDWHMGI